MPTHLDVPCAVVTENPGYTQFPRGSAWPAGSYDAGFTAFIGGTDALVDDNRETPVHPTDSTQNFNPAWINMNADFPPANPPVKVNWDEDDYVLVTFPPTSVPNPGNVLRVELFAVTSTGGFSPTFWLGVDAPSYHVFPIYALAAEVDGWAENTAQTTLTVADIEAGFTGDFHFTIAGGVYHAYVTYLALRVIYGDAAPAPVQQSRVTPSLRMLQRGGAGGMSGIPRMVGDPTRRGSVRQGPGSVF